MDHLTSIKAALSSGVEVESGGGRCIEHFPKLLCCYLVII